MSDTLPRRICWFRTPYRDVAVIANAGETAADALKRHAEDITALTCGKPDHCTPGGWQHVLLFHAAHIPEDDRPLPARLGYTPQEVAA